MGEYVLTLGEKLGSVDRIAQRILTEARGIMDMQFMFANIFIHSLSIGKLHSKATSHYAMIPKSKEPNAKSYAVAQ